MGRALPYAQLSPILLICLAGVARSDFASDQSECAAQLVGLAECLPYVQGAARTPTPGCCSDLKQVLSTSRKCLCVLIKDRNDPNLGLSINATQAIKLPGSCGSAVNATECIDLLHLAPNSSDAKMFKQLASGTEANSTPTASGGATATASSSSASHAGAVRVPASSGARSGGGEAWWGRDVAVGLLLWCFACLLIRG